MKILFITQYFPPEPEPGGYRIFDFAKQLVRKGHHVAVITGMPSYPTGCLSQEYRTKVYLREEVEGVHVIRGYVYPASSKAFSKRLLGFATFVCSSVIIGFLERARYDIVYGTSPPLFNGLSTYVISRFAVGTPFVFEVRDLWPETAVVLGMLRNSVPVKLAERLEKFLYHKADCIVTVTGGIRQRLISRGFVQDKIHVITNGVDVDAFRPQWADDNIWQDADLKGRFIVTYAGTHGACQGLEVVLDAATTLATYDDIRFLFVGDGAEKDRLIQLRNERRLNNVIFLDIQQKERMPRVWAMSNVCLVSLKKLDLFRAALPTKMFEGMACARPILLAVDGEARELVKRAKAGICVEPGNSQQIAEAVMTLYNNPQLCANLGKNGGDFVTRYFSREILTDRLEKLLREIVVGAETRRKAH